MKKIISAASVIALTAAMSLSGCGGGGTEADPTAPEHFILTGEYSDGLINFTQISDDAEVLIWDEEKGDFKEGELSEESVVGNFTRLSGKDDNGTASKVEIVPYSSKAEFWDEDARWIDGAGSESEPAVDDSTGRKVFSKEYMIPLGERILDGFKLGDYSGTTDFANVKDSRYWSDIDFYNAVSSDTLTILSGYRSTLQTTGWTCGLSSILSVLEWYGVRDGLNDLDLAALRTSEEAEQFARGSEINEMESVFAKLTELGITGGWDITTSESEDTAELLTDPEWLQEQLAAGHPVIAGWNSYGWHYQTIIGYDNMGTEDTNDDVLIIMDPYDTTDHNNNGYTVESYERLVYGVWTSPETGISQTKFIMAVPKDGWEYTAEKGKGITPDRNNKGIFTDSGKMSHGDSAEHISRYYPDTEGLGDNGLAAAACEGYERSGDHQYSPYYRFMDFHNMKDSGSLEILTGFETLQQSTE